MIIIIILFLYVDDFVIFGKTKGLIDGTMKLLSEKFKIKVLGRTQKLLCVKFCEENGRICVHQESYISEVCEKYSRYKIPITSLLISKGTLFPKIFCPKNEAKS